MRTIYSEMPYLYLFAIIKTEIRLVPSLRASQVLVGGAKMGNLLEKFLFSLSFWFESKSWELIQMSLLALGNQVSHVRSQVQILVFFN